MIDATSTPAPSETTYANNAASNMHEAAPGGDMDKDAFLRLLVTQLSNQDPLNPMEGQEFAAQLAQFTSVERLTNIEEGINSQSDHYDLLSQNVNSGVAAGLLGRHVEASGNEVSLGDADVQLGFTLPDAAASVSITIRDAGGAKVRTLDVGPASRGNQDVTWDGTTDGGQDLPAGTYSFEVMAVDAGGDALEAEPFTSGRVERVTFGSDGIQLMVGDMRIPMRDIRSVSEAPANP